MILLQLLFVPHCPKYPPQNRRDYSVMSAPMVAYASKSAHRRQTQLGDLSSRRTYLEGLGGVEIPLGVEEFLKNYPNANELR